MKTELTLQREQQLLALYRYLENQMIELMGRWVQTVRDAAVKVDDPDRRARVLHYPRQVLEAPHPVGTRFDEVGR